MRAKYIVEAHRNGNQGWWRIKTRNGRIRCHSETYGRYRDARHAARQMAVDLKAVLREVGTANI